MIIHAIISFSLDKDRHSTYYNKRYITNVIDCQRRLFMPPKIRISKDMIIDAAIAIVRQNGFESINARSVAQILHCSTQPVMYHFETIDGLKRAAFARADHRPFE